jgi:hypothetical protein
MSLLSRAQEIFGKKVFREDVTFSAKIISKNGKEVYAEPNSNEGSWGTAHTHFEKIVDGYNPSDTSVHEVVCYNLPTGVKGIDIRCVMAASTAGRVVSISDKDGNTFVVAENGTTTTNGRGSGPVPLTGDKKFYWDANDADVSSVSIWILRYYI